jgi:hypothetical protein
MNDKKCNIEKFIVYINEFDKYDENNEPICRNLNCNRRVCKPFRKYCSNSVLKRDNFTCQICEIKLHKKKRYNKVMKNWLECDHIIPKSYYYNFGYRFDTLENKIKTILEFYHNKDNLRTLCYKCHKEVTIKHKKTKKFILND